MTRPTGDGRLIAIWSAAAARFIPADIPPSGTMICRPTLEPEADVTHRSTRLHVVGMLVLIAGIIGMHSLTVTSAHGPSHHPRPAVHEHASAPAVQTSLLDACDCNGHNGFHACVFVMTELLTILGLALLYWLGVAPERSVQARIRQALRRRQRAPPWTVLTLAELSLLRI